MTTFGMAEQGVGLFLGFGKCLESQRGNRLKSKASPRVGSQPQNCRVQKGHSIQVETSLSATHECTHRTCCPMWWSQHCMLWICSLCFLNVVHISFFHSFIFIFICNLISLIVIRPCVKLQCLFVSWLIFRLVKGEWIHCFLLISPQKEKILLLFHFTYKSTGIS